MNEVLIALGGNLGDVPATFQKAIEMLQRDLADIRMSRLYTTAPVYDKPGAVVPVDPAPDYTNAVLFAKTALTPHALLKRLLGVESQLGRLRPAPECSPRTIDLDLLFYQNDIIKPQSPGDLELPHPRLHQRLFVLEPACDVAPDWTHPILHQTIRELCESLKKGYD